MKLNAFTSLLCAFLFFSVVLSKTLNAPENDGLERHQLGAVRTLWKEYKAKHSLNFSDTVDEDERRFTIFLKNYKFIQRHNNDTSKTFKLAINHLAHLTNREYRHKFGLLKTKKELGAKKFVKLFPTDKLPKNAEIDWRTYGVVGKVKDQEHCGSCWAFATTGAMESAIAINTTKLVSLSEQHLVDCTEDLGNYGCNGGETPTALYYAATNGLQSEDDYPYEARNRKCRDTKGSEKYLISQVGLVENGEEALRFFLYNHGPLSVSIDASQDTFRFYSSGVYYDDNCSPVDLDHAVVAVGFKNPSENGKTPGYYIVRNSWGTNWGNDGYINMIMDMDNNCGIASDAVAPIV